MHPVWLVAIAAFLVNLPFGYWREGLRKLSFPWFLSVHAAVPVVAGVRILAGVRWELTTFPILVAGYFGGQYVGARLRRRLRPTGG